MSPMPSRCEDIRHTFTHHFESFTVCCTIVTPMVSILLLRVYFWNHVFNISFQGAFRVPQEWCSWTRAHASASSPMILMFPETSLPGREFGKWIYEPVGPWVTVNFSHWYGPCVSHTVALWAGHLCPFQKPLSLRGDHMGMVLAVCYLWCFGRT